MGILSILSMVYYTIALSISGNQSDFVARYLRCAGILPENSDYRNERVFIDFLKKFLRPDGVFLLRLIEVVSDYSILK